MLIDVAILELIMLCSDVCKGVCVCVVCVLWKPSLDVMCVCVILDLSLCLVACGVTVMPAFASVG